VTSKGVGEVGWLSGRSGTGGEKINTAKGSGRGGTRKGKLGNTASVGWNFAASGSVSKKNTQDP